MTKDKATRDRFVELRAEGMPFAKIAKELNIAHNTSVSWGKELYESIRAVKAINDEETMEKYHMTSQWRRKTFGDRYLAVQDELDRRDLSEISTTKLLDLEKRCLKDMLAEMPKQVFFTDEEVAEQKKKREDGEDFEKRLERRSGTNPILEKDDNS
jgi:hypothetical protein